MWCPGSSPHQLTHNSRVFRLRRRPVHTDAEFPVFLSFFFNSIFILYFSQIRTERENAKIKRLWRDATNFLTLLLLLYCLFICHGWWAVSILHLAIRYGIIILIS